MDGELPTSPSRSFCSEAALNMRKILHTIKLPWNPYSSRLLVLPIGDEANSLSDASSSVFIFYSDHVSPDTPSPPCPDRDPRLLSFAH